MANSPLQVSQAVVVREDRPLAHRAPVRPTNIQQVREFFESHRGQRILITGSGRGNVAATGPVAMLDMSGMRGLVELDEHENTATFLAGTTVDQAAVDLEADGYSIVGAPADAQATLGGAASLGAHGFNPKCPNFSGTIARIGLVTVDGDYLRISPTENPQYWAAARMSGGALGAITDVTVSIRKYKALRSERITRNLNELVAELDEARTKVDFFRAEWRPTAGTAKVHIGWLEDASPAQIPARAFALEPEVTHAGDHVGFRARVSRAINRILPVLAPVADRVSSVFDRDGRSGLRDGRDVAGRADRPNFVEYLFPQERAARVIDELGRLASNSRSFGRTRARLTLVAADDAWLSAAYRQDSVAIALESNETNRAAFAEAENLFIALGGFPNWAGWTTMTGPEAAYVMPRFSDFGHIATDLDPYGRLAGGMVSRVRAH